MSHELVTNGVNGTASIHAAILEEGLVVQMQQMLSRCEKLTKFTFMQRLDFCQMF